MNEIQAGNNALLPMPPKPNPQNPTQGGTSGVPPLSPTGKGKMKMKLPDGAMK